mgnify:CR=1 FL=1
MSIKVIKIIREAEEKAEEIKKDSSITAKQIITEAKAEAQNIVEEAEKQAESHRESAISKAESEGQLLYDSIINNAAKECEELTSKANGNMNNAVSIILERIVKTSGNS